MGASLSTPSFTNLSSPLWLPAIPPDLNGFLALGDLDGEFSFEVFWVLYPFSVL